MKILINDIAQLATTSQTLGSDKVTSPALQDVATDLSYTFTCRSTTVNCLCLGNFAKTAAVTITLTLTTTLGPTVLTKTYGYIVGEQPSNIIWELGADYTGIIQANVTFDSDLSYIGRIGFGNLRDLPIYKSREPGYQSSTQYRETVSGQVVDAAGGFSRRTIGCELKTKINSTILLDYSYQKNKIAKKLPYFIDFTSDSRLGFVTVFYAYDDSEVLFQSSMADIKYSKKFNFREAF